MRPAFLALAGAASMSTAFAAVEAVALVTMLSVPAIAVGIADARAADAPTLYRWKEADGSLTYSPTAPTDGTPYDAVDPTTMRPLGTPAARAARSSAAAGDVASPGVRASGAPIVRTAPPGQSARALATPAPSLGAAARRPAAPAPVVTAADSPSSESAPSAEAAGIIGSSDKERRCGELEKRVVSLERRLMTPLSADAMDETVVQMARYQRSVDRHCR